MNVFFCFSCGTMFPPTFRLSVCLTLYHRKIEVDQVFPIFSFARWMISLCVFVFLFCLKKPYRQVHISNSPHAHHEPFLLLVLPLNPFARCFRRCADFLQTQLSISLETRARPGAFSLMDQQQLSTFLKRKIKTDQRFVACFRL